MKTSQVTACVWDNGLFPSLACKLAEGYAKVFYFCPWNRYSPKLNQGWIGKGLDGIEVIESPWGPQFDSIDLHVFPDTNFGHEQVYLESIGKAVWGARMGEELENCRECTKRWLKSKGLPVGPYQVVKGMAELRAYLKTHKDQFVKISKWRGTAESFKSESYKLIEPKLDVLENDLGAFKEILEFVVEEEIPDCVEVGIDAFFIDELQPQNVFAGIEQKDCAFLGVFAEYASLPKGLTQFNDTVAPLMKRFNYRGFFSSEVRINKAGRGFMIDATTRAPSPPSELYQEIYTNLAEIVWQGSNGVLVEPEAEAKYGAQVMIDSDWADKGWQPLEFPDELRRYVKLKFATKINGRHYTIPQSAGVVSPGSVIGWGPTLQAAIDDCKAHAKEVSGYFVDCPTDGLDKAMEQVEQCEEFGLTIF
jgi:hypothetical protein